MPSAWSLLRQRELRGTPICEPVPAAPPEWIYAVSGHRLGRDLYAFQFHTECCGDLEVHLECRAMDGVQLLFSSCYKPKHADQMFLNIEEFEHWRGRWTLQQPRRPWGRGRGI